MAKGKSWFENWLEKDEEMRKRRSGISDGAKNFFFKDGCIYSQDINGSLVKIGIPLEKSLWTRDELLEEYEKIKNIPIREDITLTPEILFYMFEVLRKI